MTMATKAGLLGMWRIDRRIVDARGPDAHFAGNMTVRELKDAPDTLFVGEGGALKVGDQTPVSANRIYHWVFKSAACVEVLFADGRPFHTIDLTSPTPTAHHDCPPDQYQVSYEFQKPNEWRATWTVKGPRKDYVMTSIMTRPKHWNKWAEPSPKGPLPKFEITRLP